MDDMHRSMTEFANLTVGSPTPLAPLGPSTSAQLCTPTTVVTVAAIAFTACTWTALGGKVARTSSPVSELEPDASVEELLGMPEGVALAGAVDDELIAA